MIKDLLREEINDYFKTEDEFLSFMENTEYLIWQLDNDNIELYKNKIFSLKDRNIGNIDYLNELQSLLKNIEVEVTLKKNDFKKIDKIDIDIEYTGIDNNINFNELELDDISFNKLNEDTKEIFLKYLPNLNIEEIKLDELKKINFTSKEKKKILNDVYFLNKTLMSEISYKKKKASINLNDVYEKNGKKYFIETKKYPKLEFGSKSSNYIQLMKLQKAKEEGILDEVVFKFQGNLSKEFLDFIKPKDMKSSSRINDISILYDIPLPSGKIYTFILKSGENSRENIENLTRSFNDNTYNNEDLEIINRLFDAKMTGKLEKILLEFRNKESSKDLSKFRNILDEKYNSFYTNLRDVGVTNSRDESLYINEINDDKMKIFLDDYQKMINSSVSSQKQKAIYIIKEEDYDKVVKIMKDMIIKIRLTSPDIEKSRNLFRLDMEHIMLDAIQNFQGKLDSNKKGRDYKRLDKDGNDLFLPIEKLKDSIQNEPLQPKG